MYLFIYTLFRSFLLFYIYNNSTLPSEQGDRRAAEGLGLGAIAALCPLEKHSRSLDDIRKAASLAKKRLLRAGRSTSSARSKPPPPPPAATASTRYAGSVWRRAIIDTGRQLRGRTNDARHGAWRAIQRFRAGSSADSRSRDAGIENRTTYGVALLVLNRDEVGKVLGSFTPRYVIVDFDVAPQRLATAVAATTVKRVCNA